MFTALRRYLLDLLYPRRCLICNDDLDHAEPGPLCRQDQRKVIPLDDPFCDRCGQKLFAQATGELLCEDCRKASPPFDRAFSATLYNEPMQTLVHLFKYGMRQHLAGYFAEWMIEFAHRYIDTRGLDVIVPVPLHWRRFQYRSFNQAVALARPLAREFGLPIVKHVLRRTRHTQPQVNLGAEERVTNIKGAFAVRGPHQIVAKNVLLIDDVYTTGATVSECARVLKKAGAASVVVFTLTRPVQ